jgi:hypothetical protein
MPAITGRVALSPQPERAIAAAITRSREVGHGRIGAFLSSAGVFQRNSTGVALFLYEQRIRWSPTSCRDVLRMQVEYRHLLQDLVIAHRNLRRSASRNLRQDLDHRVEIAGEMQDASLDLAVVSPDQDLTGFCQLVKEQKRNIRIRV